MYNSYSAHSITIIITVPLIIFLHLLRSIAPLCSSANYLCPWSLPFLCFSGPTSFSGSLNFQSNTFFSQSSSPFLKSRPHHRNLFLSTTFTMYSISNCFLNSTPNINLIIIISAWYNPSYFFLFSDVSFLHNIQLHKHWGTGIRWLMRGMAIGNPPPR